MGEKDWFDYLVGAAQIVTGLGVLAAFRQAKITQEQVKLMQEQLKESQTPKVSIHTEDLGRFRFRYLLVNQKNISIYVTHEVVLFGEDGRSLIDPLTINSHLIDLPDFKVENKEYFLNQGGTYRVVIDKQYFLNRLFRNKKEDLFGMLYFPNFKLRSMQDSKTEDIHMMELRFKVPDIPDPTFYFYWDKMPEIEVDGPMLIRVLTEKLRDIEEVREKSRNIYFFTSKEIRKALTLNDIAE